MFKNAEPEPRSGMRLGFTLKVIDINAEAIAVATANARRNGCDVDCREGDLLAPLQGETFDLICCHPPAIPHVDPAAWGFSPGMTTTTRRTSARIWDAAQKRAASGAAKSCGRGGRFWAEPAPLQVRLGPRGCRRLGTARRPG